MAKQDAAERLLVAIQQGEQPTLPPQPALAPTTIVMSTTPRRPACRKRLFRCACSCEPRMQLVRGMSGPIQLFRVGIGVQTPNQHIRGGMSGLSSRSLRAFQNRGVTAPPNTRPECPHPSLLNFLTNQRELVRFKTRETCPHPT
jgi:hypothetical protein